MKKNNNSPRESTVDSDNNLKKIGPTLLTKRPKKFFDDSLSSSICNLIINI